VAAAQARHQAAEIRVQLIDRIQQPAVMRQLWKGRLLTSSLLISMLLRCSEQPPCCQVLQALHASLPQPTATQYLHEADMFYKDAKAKSSAAF
jgi:hypothetical protein